MRKGRWKLGYWVWPVPESVWRNGNGALSLPWLVCDYIFKEQTGSFQHGFFGAQYQVWNFTITFVRFWRNKNKNMCQNGFWWMVWCVLLNRAQGWIRCNSGKTKAVLSAKNGKHYQLTRVQKGMWIQTQGFVVMFICFLLAYERR